MNSPYDPYNQGVQRQAAGVAPQREQPQSRMFPQGGFGGPPQNSGVVPPGQQGLRFNGGQNQHRFGGPAQNGGINPGGMYNQMPQQPKGGMGQSGPYDPYGKPGGISGAQPIPGPMGGFVGPPTNVGINPNGMYTGGISPRGGNPGGGIGTAQISEGYPQYPMPQGPSVFSEPYGGFNQQPMPPRRDLFQPPPVQEGNPGEAALGRKNPYMQSYIQSF